MKIRSMGLAPLLAAGVAGLAITLAPTSDASPTTSVSGAGRSSDSSGAGHRVELTVFRWTKTGFQAMSRSTARPPFIFRRCTRISAQGASITTDTTTTSSSDL